MVGFVLLLSFIPPLAHCNRRQSCPWPPLIKSHNRRRWFRQVRPGVLCRSEITVLNPPLRTARRINERYGPSLCAPPAVIDPGSSFLIRQEFYFARRKTRRC